MACVTLKRSLDFDPIHPAGSCSPRPHKRRRCFPMAAPLSGSSAMASPRPQSAFLEATPTLTPEQIAQNVKEEIRRLKRRKMLQTGEKGMECEGGYESPSSPPTFPLSPSAFPGRCSPLSSYSQQHHSAPTKDKNLFTFKQVHLICEQLIREREKRVREEYDKVLSSKLAEQYDCFVRFTNDQIHRRLSQAALPSYLS